MSEEASDVPVDVTMRRRTLVGVPAMPQLGQALEVRCARVEDARELASLLGSASEARRGMRLALSASCCAIRR
jgi:hypothetical protein